MVRPNDVDDYLYKYNPVQLHWNKTINVNPNFETFTFGKSKGLTFNRVLIYPTDDMEKWIIDNNTELTDETRAKFYVAITRARYSVGIIYNQYHANLNTDGVKEYQ